MRNVQSQGAMLQALDEAEMRDTVGGSWARMFEALALSALSNWQDIREGFQDGFNGKPYRYQ